MQIRQCAAVLSVCFLAMVGCGSAPDPAPPDATTTSAPQGGLNPLADTEWRLVAIQSMDDSQDTLRPDDRSKYTMRLGADGTVSMRLNCNSATGTWMSKAADDTTSGTFELGPLATTTAVCPPPSLDGPLTTQAEYVRGYLLRDGRLSLSLMADGGILVWEPADIEVPFETTRDTALEGAILDAAPSYTKAVVDADRPGEPARYIYVRTDLNEDGRAEVLVFLMGSFFCGTGGCNLMVFTPAPDGGYSLVNDFAISRPPVILSPKLSEGWHELWRLESGGGAAAQYVRHAFDGLRYVEAERVPVGDVPPEGRWLLAGELGPDVGARLEPRP